MEDPNDDIPLDPENVSEWYGVCSLAQNIFERCGHLADTCNVVAERFDPYSIDVNLLKLAEFSPDRAWRLAEEIKRGLRSFKHYWRVRIGIVGEREGFLIDGESDEFPIDGEAVEIPILLEIDKYGVYGYRGKVTIQRFDHIGGFFRKFWGTDFGFEA